MSLSMRLLSALFFIFFSISDLHAFSYSLELEKGTQLAYNSQFPEAEKIVNAYLAKNPNDPLGYMVRGTILDWKREIMGLKNTLDNDIIETYKTANLLAFHAWEKDENNPDKKVVLGNSYMFLAKKWLDLGHTSRAGLILKKSKKHMEEAISQNPKLWEAYMALGIFNFYAANMPSGMKLLASIVGITGDETKGLDLLTQAATHPNFHKTDALLVLTHAYGKTKGDYPMSAKYLDQLIATYPNNPHFRFLKADYAFRAKRNEEAKKLFAEFTAYCTTRVGGCNRDYQFSVPYEQMHLAMREKNYTQALVYVNQIPKVDDGTHPDKWAFVDYYHGLILKSQGKNAEARGFLQKAIDNPVGNDHAKELARDELAGLK